MSKEKLLEKVKRFMYSSENSLDEKIAKVMKRNAMQFSDLVGALEPYLTDANIQQRCRALYLLARVLEGLPKDYIKEAEGTSIAIYSCQRLRDHHSMQPFVIYSMSALASYPAITMECIVQMMKDVDRNVSLQSMEPAFRRHYFKMVLYLVVNRIDGIEGYKNDFIKYYIQTSGGERDAKCLSLHFECVQKLAKKYATGSLAEDLFESVACYFPIGKYSVPANDPTAITPANLQARLRSCLVSTPQFGPPALPLFLEKISSSLPDALEEAFAALAEGSKVYNITDIYDYASAIWTAIQIEMRSIPSTTIEAAAIEAWKQLMKAILNDEDEKRQEQFVQGILADVRKFFLDVDWKNITASTKLMIPVAECSIKCCGSLVENLVPLFIDLYNKYSLLEARYGLMNALIHLLDIIKKTDHIDNVRIGLTDATLGLASQPLNQYKEDVLMHFITVANSDDCGLACKALAGLSILMVLPGLLKPCDLEVVCETFFLRDLSESDVAVRQEACLGLMFIGRHHPKLLKDKVIHPIVQVLRTKDLKFLDDVGHLGDHITWDYLLRQLALFSQNNEIAQNTIPFFVNLLYQCAARPCNPATLMDTKDVLHALDTVVLSCYLNESIHEIISKEAVLHFFRLLANGIERLKTGGTKSVFTNTEIVNQMAAVTRKTVSGMETMQAYELASETVELYLNNCIGIVGLQDTKYFCIKGGLDLLESEPVNLFVAIVCSLNQQPPCLTEIEDSLISGILFEGEQAFSSTLMYCKCLATLCNKCYGDMDLELDNPLSKLYKAFMAKDGFMHVRHKTFRALIWMAKAAVLANWKVQQKLLHIILDNLEIGEFASEAAEAFLVILNVYSDVMTKDTHACITMFYQQRMFQLTYPTLLKGFENVHGEDKTPFLTAITYLLRFVPSEVLMPVHQSLTPVLVQALNTTTQPKVWTSVLVTLYDIIQDVSKGIQSFVPDLVPRLLDLVGYQESMIVRIEALRCLGAMTKLPDFIIVPWKQQILQGIKPALDDHKRLVRKDAALARNEWFMVGTPS